MILVEILLWIEVPARNERGYSRPRVISAMHRFMVCRMGTGLTAESKFLVRKSKKNFGQKKASREAATWSGVLYSWLVRECQREGEK